MHITVVAGAIIAVSGCTGGDAAVNLRRRGFRAQQTRGDAQHVDEQRGKHLQGRGAAGASSKRAGDPGKADAAPGAGTARSRVCAGDTSADSCQHCRQLDRQQPRGEVRRARHVQLYAPRPPDQLSKKRWVSCDELHRQLEPLTPLEAERWHPTYVKQLVTELFKDHPLFAGRPFSEWSKKLMNRDALAHSTGKTHVTYFCLEHTPSISRVCG